MKLQAVAFQRIIVWKDRGDKSDAYKSGIFQLSIKEHTIHFKNGWVSKKYKSNEEAKSVAETILKD